MSHRDSQRESRHASRREFAFPDPTRPDPSLKPLQLNARPPAKAPTREAPALDLRRELPTNSNPRLELTFAAGTGCAPTGGRAR